MEKKLIIFSHGMGVLKENNFDNYLVNLLKETDIPIIGGSAGAVIFGKDNIRIKPLSRHAELGVNLSGAMAIYLLETHEALKSAKN